MSSFTNFLNLFKWNAVEDGEEEFNIDKALNDNWDKIDTKLETHIKGVNKEVSDFKTEVSATVQDLTDDVSKKVDKVIGKELSTNDFTDDLKQKLDGIREGSFLPSGGTTGQVLAKASEQDGDVEWVEQSGKGAIINSSNVDVATATLTEHQEFSTTEQWQNIKLNLNEINNSNFSLQDGGIKIPKGISKILISGHVTLSTAISGRGQIAVKKNGGTVGRVPIKYKDENYYEISLVAQSFEVVEGDVITLCLTLENLIQNKLIRKDFTYMTIVAIHNKSEVGTNDIIVSPTEPQTDRRKVWFQSGENLFDYKNAEYMLAYINIQANNLVASDAERGHRFTFLECKPNTTYTISKAQGSSFRVATFTNKPQIGSSINLTKANHKGTSVTITTGENDNYLGFVCFSVLDGDTGTYQEVYSTVRVEESSTATIPTIYVKSNNGIYEEFIRKEQKNIITASAEDNYTTTTTGVEKLTLIETAKIGDKLEILDGGIKIGKGVKYIKATGQIFYSGGVNNGDVLGLYIFKNRATIKLAQEKATGATVLVLPEYLIEVAEGDIIYLYARDSTNAGAMVNTHSFLTVEVV